MSTIEPTKEPVIEPTKLSTSPASAPSTGPVAAPVDFRVKPGTVVPVLEPVDYKKLYNTIHRPLYNCVFVNPFGKSEIYPTPATDRDAQLQAQADRRTLRYKYPLAGGFKLQGSRPTMGMVFLNEIWCGFPPMNPWDGGENNFEIPTEGKPWWWKTLKDEGYKRWGPGILLVYPGGVKAYFDRFIQPMLDASILSNFDYPKYQTIKWNATSVTLDAASLALMKKFKGFASMNTETFFPYRRPHILQTQNGFHVAGAYLEAFKLALEQKTGKTYGKDLTHEELVKEWDTVVLGPEGLVGMVFSHMRKRMPNAKIMGYDWPVGTCNPLVDANYGRHALLKEEELSGELDIVWNQLDVLTPSHGYTFGTIVDDSVSVVPKGSIKYSAYISSRSGICDRMRALKAHSGKPVFPFMRMTGGDDNHPGWRRALTPLEHSANTYVMKLSDADGVIIWEAAGFEPIAESELIEVQLKCFKDSSAVFDKYFGIVARTPPDIKLKN